MEEEAPVPRKRRASVFDVETAPVKVLEAEAAAEVAEAERQRNVRIASPRSEEYHGDAKKRGKKGRCNICIYIYIVYCSMILFVYHSYLE